MPGFIGTDDVIDRSSFYLLLDDKRIIGNVTIYIFSADIVENSYVTVILIMMISYNNETNRIESIYPSFSSELGGQRN